VPLADSPRRPRDSALDAITLGFRVLGRPAYLWAPILLGVIVALPLLAIPGYAERPTIVTQADLDAFVQAFLAGLVFSTAIAVVLGPIATSVTYRLGAQFVQGESAQPFPDGWIGLAWRFFLQVLLLTLLWAAGAVGAIVVGAVIQTIVGVPLAFLIVGIGALITFVGVAARLLIAPVILLTGAGPVQSIQRSWRATRGHWGQVIRWLSVTALIVGIVGALVNVAAGFVLGALGLGSVTPVVGAAVAAPFHVITAIVYIELSGLLVDSGTTGSEAVTPMDPFHLPDPVNT
jgi:hypothetical protein